MYTLLKEDEDTTKLMVVGYSVLNIFVESGTVEQPEKDDIASTVSSMYGYIHIYIYIYSYLCKCSYVAMLLYYVTLTAQPQ